MAKVGPAGRQMTSVVTLAVLTLIWWWMHSGSNSNAYIALGGSILAAVVFPGGVFLFALHMMDDWSTTKKWAYLIGWTAAHFGVLIMYFSLLMLSAMALRGVNS